MEARLMITTVILFAFGALLITMKHKLQNLEFLKRTKDWTKYGVYLILVSTMLLAAYWRRWLIAAIFLSIALGGAFELNRNLRNKSNFSFGISLAAFLVLTFCLSHLLWENITSWFSTFSFLFILVATADSFSQLWGKLLGSHRMCPSISPGKTWEGLLGGLASTVALSSQLGFLMPSATSLQLVVLGLTVGTAATFGDLLFSYIKRKIKIKDFSGLLPGHGGILDRFDSLIVAAPVFYWTKLLLIK